MNKAGGTHGNCPAKQMNPVTAIFPQPLLLLAAAFLTASLAHFIHNAEYVAYYPGMPHWLTREKVCLFWLAFASPGVVAFISARLRRPRLALTFLAIYGALWLDALGHYAIALCSEHTLVASVTIWAEAVMGLALCATSMAELVRAAANPLQRSG